MAPSFIQRDWKNLFQWSIVSLNWILMKMAMKEVLNCQMFISSISHECSQMTQETNPLNFSSTNLKKVLNYERGVYLEAPWSMRFYIHSAPLPNIILCLNFVFLFWCFKSYNWKFCPFNTFSCFFFYLKK